MTKAVSPWRYPGGKARLASKILPRLPEREWNGYAEPFVGGGGLTFAFLPLVKHGSLVQLNDADPRVAAWWSVLTGSQKNFDELISRLSEYDPTVKSFYHYRDKGLKSGRLVDRAFSAMVTNRCAFSGILSGGPIGGPSQGSQYDVACRYNPKRLVQLHERARAALSVYDVQVTSQDFREFLDSAQDDSGVFWYLDPPYVRQGPTLYPTHFDQTDHEDLAKRVLATDSGWAVSYDDAQWVQDRFVDEPVELIEIPVRYTITAKKEYTSELLIVPVNQGRVGE